MSYYKVLGLTREPFSTSPDPDFFYESAQHYKVMMRLMISLRLRRGLNVVLGDVGTGKTTLSRKLFQMLKIRKDIISHMILDPTCESESVFLESLARTMNIRLRKRGLTVLELKAAIKDYLFLTAVKRQKTVVVLIDEAHKLNDLSLEVLRLLLNYETNDYKMLQLVLMGQLEFFPALNRMSNFSDRISMKYLLRPMSESETCEMIRFRISKAGRCGSDMFTPKALRAVYFYTKGYPRRISMLCHELLTSLVVSGRMAVDENLVHDVSSHRQVCAAFEPVSVEEVPYA